MQCANATFFVQEKRNTPCEVMFIPELDNTSLVFIVSSRGYRVTFCPRKAIALKSVTNMEKRDYLALILCRTEGKTMELDHHADKIEAKIEEWNARIEQLKVYSQDAGSEKRKEYEEEIDLLITIREATRRGLLHLSDSGEELCSSCPAESSREEQASSE